MCLHWPAIADIDGLAPHFQPNRSAHVGHRLNDEYADEVRTVLGCGVPASVVTACGVAEASSVLQAVAGPTYWLRVDVDVLDPDGSEARLLVDVVTGGLSRLGATAAR